MAKPTPSTTPSTTEPTAASPSSSSITEWSPPTVALERQQHRRQLSTLPIGAPVLIWRPSGSPVNGWSWCGLSGGGDALVRSPEGEIRSVRAVWCRPAPEAAA